MRVAVTGANGHVGGNLVRALLAAGHAVRVLVHHRTEALDGLAVERLRGDVDSPATLRALFAGVDLAYHLAAQVSVDGDHGGRVQRVNVEGTRNVADAALAAGVRRLVHMSSVHAFVTAPGRPITEASPRADGPGYAAYDRSKAAGEEQVRQAIARGLDAVILNPTGVLGREDFRPSRMGRFFLLLFRRRLPALVEGGFDWVDVRDVVAGALAAAARGRTGDNYLLSGNYATVPELAALAARVTGVPAPRLTTPRWLAGASAPAALLLARALRPDPLFTPEAVRALGAAPRVSHAKAAEELGYAPRPLADTVADVYRSFRERGVIPRAAPLVLTAERLTAP